MNRDDLVAAITKARLGPYINEVGSWSRLTDYANEWYISDEDLADQILDQLEDDPLPERIFDARIAITDAYHDLARIDPAAMSLWSRLVDAKLALAHLASYMQPEPGWEGIWDRMMQWDDER